MIILHNFRSWILKNGENAIYEHEIAALGPLCCSRAAGRPRDCPHPKRGAGATIAHWESRIPPFSGVAWAPGFGGVLRFIAPGWDFCAPMPFRAPQQDPHGLDGRCGWEMGPGPQPARFTGDDVGRAGYFHQNCGKHKNNTHKKRHALRLVTLSFCTMSC